MCSPLPFSIHPAGDRHRGIAKHHRHWCVRLTQKLVGSIQNINSRHGRKLSHQPLSPSKFSFRALAATPPLQCPCAARKQRHLSPSRHLTSVTRTLTFFPERPSLHNLPPLKAVLEAIHIYSPAAELHALKLEPSSLFLRASSRQLDLSSSAKHPMPRKLIRRLQPQHTSHSPVVKRIPGSRRHLAVRAYPSGRNSKNHPPERTIALRVSDSCFTKNASFSAVARRMVQRKEMARPRCSTPLARRHTVAPTDEYSVTQISRRPEGATTSP